MHPESKPLIMVSQERKVKLSTIDDIEQILSMFDYSRSIMRNNGNLTQWVNGYPSEEVLREDISRHQSFVIEERGRLIGTFAFIIGRDPTYTRIYEGSWLHDERRYGTIHRLACVPGTSRVAQTAFQWAASQIPALRADTHHDNLIMRHVLESFGFQYRGVIFVADGTPRDAYQYFSPLR